ncbi:MAG: DUF401 family protein [Selenomonadaceae bacterium]|nr:DUF401 family protein [Selenomonadaceae bacterium]
MRKKFPIGISMIASGVFLWIFQSRELESILNAGIETLKMNRTYDILFAMYFVMCLEIELRKSGLLDSMVETLHGIFSDTKILLAAMPAFLGLLPSIGGARFSAPIVDELSRGLNLSAEKKSAINFWFRHIFEFSNPIIPGLILACSIAGVSFPDFLRHIAWMTFVALIVGYLVILHPIDSNLTRHKYPHGKNLEFIIAISPMISTFLLATTLNLRASIATGISIAALYLILQLMNRRIDLREILIGAIDLKMLGNILAILFFVQLLVDIKILDEVVAAFRNSPLPIPMIIAGISFVIGILTGMSQGHVAIVMPIVAAIDPGNLDLAGIAMAFGVAGQMLTPTHVCLLVTIDFFHADFFKTLIPLIICEIFVLGIFSTVTFLTWG